MTCLDLDLHRVSFRYQSLQAALTNGPREALTNGPREAALGLPSPAMPAIDNAKALEDQNEYAIAVPGSLSN